MNAILSRISPIPLLLGIVFVASLAYMWPVGLMGDEFAYARSASELFGALIRLDFSQLDLVKNAWFPPGMAFVLLPLQILFGGEAPDWALRVYILTINTILLASICQFLRVWISERRIVLFLALLLLNPFYITHLSTIWSELIALHAAILLLLWVHREYARDREISIVLLGFLCTFITLVRTLYLPLPLFVALTMQLANPGHVSLVEDARKIAQNTLVMVVILAGVITPWTMEASSKFGPTFLHRGSEMSRIHVYADPAFKREMTAETGHKNVFFAIHGAIAKRAEQSGNSFADQSKLELARALNDVDDAELAARFQRNVYRFFSWNSKSLFMQRYQEPWCELDNSITCTGAGIPVRIQSLVWSVVLVLGAALFILPVSRSSTGFVLNPFIFKGLIALITIHPILVFAHGRYIVQLIPLVALAIACFEWRSIKRSFDARVLASDKIIAFGQVVAIGFFVTYALLYTVGINPIIR